MKTSLRQLRLRCQQMSSAVVLFGSVILAADPAFAASVSPFTDISESYAVHQINDLYQRGIVSGVTDTTYVPTKATSRAEFVTLLDRILGLQKLNSAVPAFQDVPSNSWEYGYVQAGVSLGIINGMSAISFAPGQSLTREQAAILLVRALQPNWDLKAPYALPFQDANAVSETAKPYVAAANTLGLMTGDAGSFRPQASLTREETAVVLERILQDDRYAKITQTSAATTPSSVPIQLGWEYGDRVETTAEFEQRVEQGGVNTISPRWFFLESTGVVSDIGDSALAVWSKQTGRQNWPLVGNHFNQTMTHQFVSSAANRKTVIDQLVSKVQKYQLEGLNIDFENLAMDDRANFTAFIGELATAVHGAGAKLSVDVPPDLGTDWSQPFDYQALGQNADYVVLMGYDQHYDGGPSMGSISSLPWLTHGVTNLVSQVPASKVIMGMPFYTADWWYQNGTLKYSSMTLVAQSSLLNSTGAHLTWNASTGQYVATYSQSGITHSIWVEDSRSLALKYQVAAKNNVAGVAYWYVGGETPDVWTSLQNARRFSALSAN